MYRMPSTSNSSTNAQTIKELQNYLRTISFSDNRIPTIGIDGIFGPQTTQAVIAFQSAYNLPPNGVVDKLTWDSISSTYSHAIYEQSPANSISPFPNVNYSISLGEQNDLVFFVQIMLANLHSSFPNLKPVTINGIFDKPTQDAISTFQSKTDLPIDNIVNKQTWNSLARIYNISQLKRNG